MLDRISSVAADLVNDGEEAHKVAAALIAAGQTLLQRVMTADDALTANKLITDAWVRQMSRDEAARRMN